MAGIEKEIGVLAAEAAAEADCVAALEKALDTAGGDRARVHDAVAALQADLSTPVVLELAEPVLAPVQGDTVEMAVAMAITAVAQASPIVLLHLPPALAALRSLSVPLVADPDGCEDLGARPDARSLAGLSDVDSEDDAASADSLAAFVGACCRLLELAGARWCLLALAGACWCLLVLAAAGPRCADGACWSSCT